ncbi:flagellin hook IN motif-containing protein, partial [Vibrio campbellii]
FQIGADSGEAVIMELKDLRSDNGNMGGLAHVAANAQNGDWAVGAGADLTIGYNDLDGNAQTITINAKEGDDIEQLATYINGQTDVVQA